MEGFQRGVSSEVSPFFGTELAARRGGEAESCVVVVDCLPESDEAVGVCVVEHTEWE